MPAVLRCFNLDMIHMPDRKGGFKYLYQAIEPVIEWPEAQAEHVNNSEHWAKFIYKDIIYWFSCIPFFHLDNSTEFKGTMEILFKQYGVVAIFSSPYHP